jgi:hypothetical protein
MAIYLTQGVWSMYIKVSKKNMGICLLLCCLFLTSYLTILNTTGSIFSDMNVSDISSVGGSEHSSMSGGTNIGNFDYLSVADTSIGFFFSSAKQFRGQVTKFNLNVLTAIAAAQLISLIYSSRLSNIICTPFNSISITAFLHKKDGMK